MEHMVHSESEKYKSDLHDAFKLKFADKLTDEDLDFISKSYDKYIFEMIKLMREGKTAHEKFFSDIILKSIDAIIGYNSDRQVFLWNEGAEKIFKYTKEEITNKDINILNPDKAKANEELDSLQKEIDEKGFVTNYETLGQAKDGTIINISLSQFPIFGEKEEFLGIVSIIRDITVVKELEKELRESENLALIGQVVSSIAHNLSNPLNIISGNADYLLLEKKDGDPDFEELKVIVSEATRITKSIRSILNFAKPITPMREEVKLNDLLTDTLSGFKFLKGQKEIELKKNFCKENPGVKIDKELFKDVFLNIVGNSIQAIPANKKGLISVKTYTDEKYSYTEITDNGAGILESDIENIFKPFFSTKGYGKGTGLGLAFTERVVKEHNGTINVNSVKNKYTTFLIGIPLK
ncbi:MAG: ATP-binding protein [Candidatus Kapaibacterium sp.]